MTWTIEYNSNLRIIDLVIAGSLTGLDMKEVTSKLITLGKNQGVALFLVDTTDLELAPSLSRIIDLPDKQYEEEGLDRRIRLALVLPRSPKAKEAALFYETACVNRGWNVKTFPNREEAIEWLTRTDSSNKPVPGR